MRKIPDMSRDNFTIPWELDFSNNLIQEVTQFPLLPNMVNLIFRRNNINKLSDEAFKNLPDLKILILQNNNLTVDSLNENVFKGKYNDSFLEPLALEELDLSYNQISSFKSHTLKHLPYLKRLFLSHNPITDISWAMGAAINELHNLRELDLSQTGLNRLPNHFLTDLRNLQVLTLAENRFTTVPSEINYARNLVHLNLNANPIVSIMTGDFQAGLSTLQELQMCAMPDLRNVGAQAFSSLSSLKVLQLSDNPLLSVIDRKAFYPVMDDKLALQEIHIQNNNLMALPEDLVPWLRLKYVDIQNNPWNCDCHFKWVATKLIPDLEAKNPDRTLSIICAEPIEDRGMPVSDLLNHSINFECMAPHPFVNNEGRYGALIVSTIVVGVILMLTGTLIFSYVLFKRTRNGQMFGDTIKYRRAHNEDEEATSQTVHS
ncbi:leucine-rich repeat neuronal protein 1-like [Homarus americanus]|uniref:leucine-rich repeat neuronal protein 1-like n=1 Tax=Homarus americanus TaxID=6706 RepID=UPI001C46CE27|nr:leucine-rich repeat neuronal protein 1-like [Homarus americanus]